MKLTRILSFKTPSALVLDTARTLGVKPNEGRKPNQIQRVAAGLNDSVSVVRMSVAGAGGAERRSIYVPAVRQRGDEQANRPPRSEKQNVEYTLTKTNLTPPPTVDY